MWMEPTKAKIKGIFTPAHRSSFVGRGNMNVEDWELRPGGMLVQKRNSDSDQNSVSVCTINVRVKYGSSRHEIRISSQASFGELKKMLAEHTGVHPEDQKLIYKKKERDSKEYLDVARVKDGSKIVLIEDITSRERRCLEMLKSANIEKASKSLHQISLEVDKLDEEVTALEATMAGGGSVAETDIDNLIEILMTKLVVLDGITIEGDLKLPKRMKEKRIQKHIETLDMLKLHKFRANGNGGKFPSQQEENSIGKMPTLRERQPVQTKHRDVTNNGVKISFQQQKNSSGKMPIPLQKQPVQPKHRNETEKMPIQQRPLRHSESVVVTTKWETFD